MPFVSSIATASARGLGFGGAYLAPGSVLYDFDSAGTVVASGQKSVQWAVPAGVNSICVVCVGAGGWSNTSDGGTSYSGGGGGGLAYTNNILVTPGEIFTLFMGTGAYNTSTAGRYTTFTRNSGSVIVCQASGGGAGTSTTVTAVGGTVIVGTGGNTGGSGGAPDTSGYGWGGGGGGAAGYYYPGGNGGTMGGSGVSSTNGSGGGGGGSNRSVQSLIQYGGGGGGGVNLYGQQTTRVGTTGNGGLGLGTPPGQTAYGYTGYGAQGWGTLYKGLGGGVQYSGGNKYGGGSATTIFNSDGAIGGIRIIWGSGKRFPDGGVV